ncbi:hypothetical protein Hypma_004061 [Hypsizygus marmoreus]|uniref:Uncharacterized protein n=1 Tax=Hypsizygus marmoreus TaxID=39966 RepID=A0A369J0R5_HYPMA|nr:hypothetical protein Hypma_004061 [Hypsizygus marmoreus]
MVWLTATRTAKLLPHLWHRPQDIIYVPAFILFGYYFAIMKIYALFTLHETGWGTVQVSAMRRLPPRPWKGTAPGEREGQREQPVSPAAAAIPAPAIWVRRADVAVRDQQTPSPFSDSSPTPTSATPCTRRDNSRGTG